MSRLLAEKETKTKKVPTKTKLRIGVFQYDKGTAIAVPFFCIDRARNRFAVT